MIARVRLALRGLLSVTLVVFLALLTLRVTAQASDADPKTETDPPEFVSFSASSMGDCSENEEILITLTWRASHATEAWVGRDTEDAEAQPVAEVNAEQGHHDITVPCPILDETMWTVTVKGPGGTAHESHLISAEGIVPSTGDVPGSSGGTPPGSGSQQGPGTSGEGPGNDGNDGNAGSDGSSEDGSSDDGNGGSNGNWRYEPGPTIQCPNCPNNGPTFRPSPGPTFNVPSHIQQFQQGNQNQP